MLYYKLIKYTEFKKIIISNKIKKNHSKFIS